MGRGYRTLLWQAIVFKNTSSTSTDRTSTRRDKGVCEWCDQRIAPCVGTRLTAFWLLGRSVECCRDCVVFRSVERPRKLDVGCQRQYYGSMVIKIGMVLCFTAWYIYFTAWHRLYRCTQVIQLTMPPIRLLQIYCETTTSVTTSSKCTLYDTRNTTW